MKMLVTGGSGFVGYYITRYFSTAYEVDYTFLSKNFMVENGKPHLLDVRSKENVFNLFLKINPDIVIHSAALANMDLCETDRNLADQSNVMGTNNIVEACKRLPSKIIYISTSYVFDGQMEIYSEGDNPNPPNYYGKTKLMGERIVENSGLDYLILRIDQPYGWVKPWHKKNSVIRVLENFEKGGKITDVIDWYNNPTYVWDIMKAMSKLIEKDKAGIYHCVGPDYINRYEWSRKAADVFGKEKNLIIPIKGSILNLPAKRVNIRLGNEKIEKETKIAFCGVDEGMKKMLLERK